ncbi:unnamed protein product [Phaeothamnion confervicola]
MHLQTCHFGVVALEGQVFPPQQDAIFPFLSVPFSPFPVPPAVEDWDMLEKLWDHAVGPRLGIKTSDHPVLLTEKPFNTPHRRHRSTELIFEKYGAPALFVSKDAVLSCFAVGRTTGVVLDIGGGSTTVTPVYDGWAERRGVVASLLGGDALHAYCLALLQQRGVEIANPFPGFTAAAVAAGAAPGPGADVNGGHPSYLGYMRREVARDVMEHNARVLETPLAETPAAFLAGVPSMPYQLPDGTEIQVGSDRFTALEVLFDTSWVAAAATGGGGAGAAAAAAAGGATCGTLEGSDGSSSSSSSGSRQTPAQLLAALTMRAGFVQQPLEGMLYDSVTAAKDSGGGVSKDALLSNVVLAGGGSCFEGMAERVKAEVERLSPGAKKLPAANPAERKILTWLGGSILASLGSFHEMWLSKADYEEHGAFLIDKKCP